MVFLFEFLNGVVVVVLLFCEDGGLQTHEEVVDVVDGSSVYPGQGSGFLTALQSTGHLYRGLQVLQVLFEQENHLLGGGHLANGQLIFGHPSIIKSQSITQSLSCNVTSYGPHIVWPSHRIALTSYGLTSYALTSYALTSYGLTSYGLTSYGSVVLSSYSPHTVLSLHRLEIQSSHRLEIQSSHRIEIQSYPMKKVIALTTAIVSQIYYICKIYLSKDKKRKLIGLIATLQILSPQQIIRKVNSHRGAALDICRGKIFAGEPCYSVLDPSLKVAYSKLFEGRFKGLAPKNQLLKITEPSFMELRQGAVKLNMYETHNSVVLPTRIMQFKGKSMGSRLLDTLRRIFFNRSSSPSKLEMSQFYSSDKVYELFLPEGSECTVLGRFGLEGKEVVCSHPEMIFQNEQQMARYIQQSVKNLNVFHIVLATGLAVCTGLLVKELYYLAKAWRKNVEKTYSFASIKKIFQKSRVCATCHQNLSCIYHVKCSHMVVCQDCQGKSPSHCLQCKEEGSEVEMYVC